MFAELVLLGIVIAALVSPHTAGAIVSGGFVWILGAFTVVWRRFNQLYRQRVLEDLTACTSAVAWWP